MIVHTFICTVSLINASCCLQIRGMSIDEAIAQLEFNDKKGAKIMKEVGDAGSASDTGKIC